MCAICHDSKDALCADCVKKTIRIHRSQLRAIQAGTSASAKRVGSSQLRQVASEQRRRNEACASHQERISQLRYGLESVRTQIHQRHQAVNSARTQLLQRQSNLQNAKSRLQQYCQDDGQAFHAPVGSTDPLPMLHCLADIRSRIVSLKQGWQKLAQEAAEARQILVQEAIGTFKPEVRQPASSHAKARLSKQSRERAHDLIGGCPLPLVTDFKAALSSKLLPQTNAALLYLALCICQIASYSGLVIPFVPSLHVHPTIAAAPTSQWSQRAFPPIPLEYGVSDVKPDVTSKSHKITPSSLVALVTAYTMLAYDLAYICHVQALAFPLNIEGGLTPILQAIALHKAGIRPCDALAYEPISRDMSSFAKLDFETFLRSNLHLATSKRPHKREEKVAFDDTGDDGLILIHIDKT